ncbi:unnamed protein product [Pylaiella littoralis]
MNVLVPFVLLCLARVFINASARLNKTPSACSCGCAAENGTAARTGCSGAWRGTTTARGSLPPEGRRHHPLDYAKHASRGRIGSSPAQPFRRPPVEHRRGVSPGGGKNHFGERSSQPPF